MHTHTHTSIASIKHTSTQFSQVKLVISCSYHYYFALESKYMNCRFVFLQLWKWFFVFSVRLLFVDNLKSAQFAVQPFSILFYTCIFFSHQFLSSNLKSLLLFLFLFVFHAELWGWHRKKIVFLRNFQSMWLNRVLYAIQTTKTVFPFEKLNVMVFYFCSEFNKNETRCHWVYDLLYENKDNGNNNKIKLIIMR